MKRSIKIMDNLEIIKRKAMQIFSVEDLEEKIKSGKRLKIKFGADPSRPDLHIGHSVPLRVLKMFQDMGHEIIFVVGDFTAMIGDPSGKSKTRPALTFEETRKSAESYLEQAIKILDKDKTKIVFNSERLSKMNFEDIIKLTSKYTVARIMERDDFKNRFENNLPLSMHELLEEIDNIMLQDIREAHFRFAEELLKMYNSDTNFEEIKERYIQIANGGIPEDIETFAIDENAINICDLIVKVGFSNSKSEAKRMIQGKGIKVNSKTIERIDEKIEIKSDMIKKLKQESKKVMMCGDGINDSPALANADIGVSVKSGTDIAMDSSDVILTKNDLNSILKLIDISEKTVKNIKQNLFWAFFYNSLMIPVAMGIFKPIGIWVNPMIASLAMVFSSLTVIANALKLKNNRILKD